MIDRDRFDLEISEAMAELAGPTVPDYFDDVLDLTRRTSQRPSWAIPERWFNVTALADRLRVIPTAPLRPVAILLIVGLLLAALLVAIVGSRRPLPPPFGLAANGQIVYAQSGDLRVVDPVTQASRILVGDSRSSSTPLWSLDGTRLAFLRGNDAAKALVVVNADGSGLVELTGEELRQHDAYGPPAWSPDGRWIAVSHTVRGARLISLVPTDGSKQVRTLELDVDAWAPAWRPPDGAQLLFRGVAADGQPDLYVVNADGTGIRSLGLDRAWPDPERALLGAAWSPDGTRIAFGGLEFLSLRGESRYRTHIVNADGTGDRLIEAPDDVSHVWPKWSPDGRLLLFELVRGEYGANDQITLAISAADQSSLVEVADIVETDSIAAVWAPDGESIVAAYWDLNRTYRIDARTGTVAELALPRALVGDLSWQRLALQR